MIVLWAIRVLTLIDAPALKSARFEKVLHVYLVFRQLSMVPFVHGVYAVAVMLDIWFTGNPDKWSYAKIEISSPPRRSMSQLLWADYNSTVTKILIKCHYRSRNLYNDFAKHLLSAVDHIALHGLVTYLRYLYTHASTRFSGFSVYFKWLTLKNIAGVFIPWCVANRWKFFRFKTKYFPFF